MSRSSIDPLILSCLPNDIASSSSLSLSGTTLSDPSSPASPLFAKTSNHVPQLVGEHTSLRAMRLTNPDLVPQVYPLLFNEYHQKAGMVSKKFDLGRVEDKAKQRALGLALAKMHRPLDEVTESMSEVQEDLRLRGFGFSVSTYCGITEQDNEWTESCENFFRNRRLESLIYRLDDHKINAAWDPMKKKALPLLLRDIHPPPEPVILHGDLWSGNVGWANDKPIVFDPSSYYGHNEADLGITHMFGGFSTDFYDAYHSIHPQSAPYYAERIKLYELYHHLNHELMVGGSYRSAAVKIMRELTEWTETV